MYPYCITREPSQNAEIEQTMHKGVCVCVCVCVSDSLIFCSLLKYLTAYSMTWLSFVFPNLSLVSVVLNLLRGDTLIQLVTLW